MDMSNLDENGVVHGAKGQFGPDHKGGPGNPHARQIAAFRATLYETVTPEEVQAVVKKVTELAKAGEPMVRAIDAGGEMSAKLQL
jgi:hypothetical protein